MKTRSLNLCTTIVAAAGLLAFGVIADAQQPEGKLKARVAAGVKKLEAACTEDIKKYCSTITPGEGRLFFCIKAHEDKISSKCDVALFDAARNLERALDHLEQTADACWGDIEKFCSKTTDGEGRVVKCLVEKKVSLNSSCQAVISKSSAKE